MALVAALGASLSLSTALCADTPAAKRAPAREKLQSTVKPAAAAAQATKDTTRLVEKAMTGTFGTLTKRAISVEFNRKGSQVEEMLFSYEPSVKLKNVRALSELKPGDKLKVVFVQTYVDAPNGESRLAKTVAKEIAFLSRPGLSSREGAADE